MAKKAKITQTKWPVVRLLKRNKAGGPVGANHLLYINDFRVPYVKHVTTEMDSRGVALVTIKLYADIAHGIEPKKKKTKKRK